MDARFCHALEIASRGEDAPPSRRRSARGSRLPCPDWRRLVAFLNGVISAPVINRPAVSAFGQTGHWADISE
jgi:hypothetical protein